MPPNKQLPLLLATALLLSLISKSEAFQCYVCDSKDNIECVEQLPDDTRLKPQSCQNITDAKYCIKTTNLYAGELGTKRFCAAKDHGNHCRYIRQPTGAREYRSCVLTCSSENCNGAKSMTSGSTNKLLELIVAFFSTLSVISYLGGLREQVNTLAL